MRLIAITTPDFRRGEAAEIERLLREVGFWRVHIRKPEATALEVMRLVVGVAPELRRQLTVHCHFEVAEQMGLGGVHISARSPQPPQGWSGLVSRSCHSPEELALPADYCFLSPIFDSISKAGYKAAFRLEELRGVVDNKTFALGGVTPDKLPILEKIGFGGAAMLGAAWK